MHAQLKDENVRRMLNLARLIATLIASKAIQITVLKVSHCGLHQTHALITLRVCSAVLMNSTVPGRGLQ